MSYDEVQIWVDVAQFAATAGVGLYIHFTKKNDRTNQRIDDVEEDVDRRLDAHQDRIAKLEGGMSASPTHKDIDDLKKTVMNLARETSEQTGKIDAMGKQLGRVSDWLMNKAK